MRYVDLLLFARDFSLLKQFSLVEVHWHLILFFFSFYEQKVAVGKELGNAYNALSDKKKAKYAAQYSRNKEEYEAQVEEF
jgi:hypothetical protein